MKDKSEEMESLEDLKSKMKLKDGFSNQQGFKLPEDYFEKMQAEVLNRIESKPSVSEGWIRRMWIPAVAACVLIASIFVLRHQESTVFKSSSLAMQEEFSSEELYDYLIENPDVVSEDVLLEMEGMEEVIENWEDELYFNF